MPMKGSHIDTMQLTMCQGNMRKYTGNLSRVCMVSWAGFSM
jgi:hypothetical protein